MEANEFHLLEQHIEDGNRDGVKDALTFAVNNDLMSLIPHKTLRQAVIVTYQSRKRGVKNSGVTIIRQLAAMIKSSITGESFTATWKKYASSHKRPKQWYVDSEPLTSSQLDWKRRTFIKLQDESEVECKKVMKEFNLTMEDLTN